MISHSGVTGSVLLSIVVLIISATGEGTPEICEHGFYFDKAAEKCDNCHQLCHQAEIRGTSEKCHELCPDHTDSERCPVNQYFDAGIGKCEWCHALCKDASSRGQETQCQKLCPAWKNQQTTLEPKYTILGVAGNKMTASSKSITIPVWAAVVIGILALACIGLAFWFRKDIMNKIKNLCLCGLRRHPRRPYQVNTVDSVCIYEPVTGLEGRRFPETQV